MRWIFRCQAPVKVAPAEAARRRRTLRHMYSSALPTIAQILADRPAHAAAGLGPPDGRPHEFGRDVKDTWLVGARFEVEMDHDYSVGPASPTLGWLMMRPSVA